MKKLLLLTFIVVAFVSCKLKTHSQNTLKPIHVISLNISEPSGITVFNNQLYIVSDQTGNIYKTGLDGKIVSKIRTKYTDIEGVTVNDKGDFFIVDEAKRRIIKLDAKGKLIDKFKIKGKQKFNNSGLEGICFSKLEYSFYVINEKSPTQLLKVNSEGEIIEAVTLNFAKDLSGICVDNTTDTLWLVSDESYAIYHIEKNGKLINSYKIPVNKAEGIVIYNDEIYVVSDSAEVLYIFKKPL